MLNQLKAIISAQWQTMVENHRQRLAMRELIALDNQALRDLGLNRGNFHSVALYGRYETALPELPNTPRVEQSAPTLNYTLKHS
ncbi:protein of unknown function (DUF1127) [Beggiatoa alba B18LD]|uniref:DUF1127 domain-containing protein n=2 Tax=Beggiatoa alba TaxID=1022 RepID=I3CIG2_9GAMM|nr:protein of unknown function (DUF1127) [Beggiatoa alba B18LD]